MIPAALVPDVAGPSPRTVRLLVGTAAVAAALFVVGLLVAPERVWTGFLVGLVLLAGLGLAGALFVALHYVTGARWSIPIRRVPEAMTAALVPAAIGVPALLFGVSTLYAWADPAVAHGDAILEARSGWMNVPLFLLRAGICFAVWIGLAGALVRTSRRQDEDGDPAHRRRNVRLSAIFLLAFGLTFSVATFDWLMSLERHWFSTIYAMYNFAGLFLSGLAAVVLGVVVLRRRGAFLGMADEDVLHDLGRLMFGFSMLWAYLWFSQYVLIWYTNMPEETTYFAIRHGGAWEPLAIANGVLNGLVPFLVLMPRAAKRSERVLVQVAVVLLLGRWLDLYLMVQPTATPDGPAFGPFEAILPLGALAVFALTWWRALSRAPTLPLAEIRPKGV